MRRLFIFEIRADIADVRVREADNLSRIAGVGENFLVTGEAGIENDFSAAPRNGAGSAAIKNAAVFECEYGRAMGNFGQRVLLGSEGECNAKRVTTARADRRENRSRDSIARRRKP